jgi:ribosomal protein L21E
MKFKEGDYVRVISREQTPEDIKNGTYYPHFAGLSGTVDRIYDETICIKVDTESLPKDVLKRHQDVEDSIRRKWLNSLSGEARNRLSAEDRRFDLSYTILVQNEDLEAAKPAPKPKDEPRPVKSTDLDAAEEEFLKAREKAIKEG